MTALSRLWAIRGPLALSLTVGTAAALLAAAGAAQAEPVDPGPSRSHRWTAVHHGVSGAWVSGPRRAWPLSGPGFWTGPDAVVVLPDPGPAHAAQLDAAIARLGHLIRQAGTPPEGSQPATP